MFNTISQKTTINTPASGIIQKTNEKSFFITLNIKSSLSNYIFTENAVYNERRVSVLQVLLMSDNMVLCEIVYMENL